MQQKIISILKDISQQVSDKLHCDRHGSCVHFAEIFVDEVNNQYPELLNDFDVIEGYVNVKFGDGIPQEHTWIKLNNDEIIDPTFLQFNKYDKEANYSKKRTKVYSGQEYYDEGKEGSWFSERRKKLPSTVFKKGLKESIRKVLKEETLKDSLIDLIKTDGIERALKTVGGIKRLAKILEIDFEDINVQEKLVKDFIYYDNTEGVEVSFIEVRTGRSGGKILDIHIREYFDGPVNITSWYVNEMLDKLRKVFPFTVGASWHPVFTSTKPRISLDCHIIEDEVEDTENITENRDLPNEFKRRVKDLDILIDAVTKDLYPCDYRGVDDFIYGLTDEIIWELRDEHHGDVNKLHRDDVSWYIWNNKYEELKDFFYEMKKNCDE